MDQLKCNMCKKNQAESHRKSCSDCLLKRKNQAAARRKKLKDNNICDSCGVNQRRSCGIYCEDCLLKQKINREIRKTDNKCIHCGSDVVHGKTRCFDCIEYTRKIQAKMRATRKENGLCIKCGKHNCVAPHIKCDKCLSVQNDSYHKKVNDLHQKGLCVRCGNEPLENHRFCKVCYLKHIATKRAGGSDKWQALEEKFQDQNGQCPYSGVSLTLGDNADLDHRVSKHQGGTDEISNLQWLYRPVNTMKWNMSEEEFLKTVDLISKFSAIKAQKLQLSLS